MTYKDVFALLGFLIGGLIALGAFIALASSQPVKLNKVIKEERVLKFEPTEEPVIPGPPMAQIDAQKTEKYQEPKQAQINRDVQTRFLAESIDRRASYSIYQQPAYWMAYDDMIEAQSQTEPVTPPAVEYDYPINPETGRPMKVAR